MNDIRMVKFQLLIEDIKNDLIHNGACIRFPIPNSCDLRSSSVNTSLAMIYEYDKLNVYAQAIMQISSNAYPDNYSTDSWSLKHINIDEFKNPKVCINAAKEFVQYCRMYDDGWEGYKFIFWALMILTVDRTDAEEHLSLICDFARMIRISDAELEDIVYVIKTIINNDPMTEDGFKIADMRYKFGGIYERYAQR